jgi:hypothetical protein
VFRFGPNAVSCRFVQKQIINVGTLGENGTFHVVSYGADVRRKNLCGVEFGVLPR